MELKGKKTYILGVCSILYGVTGALLGKHDYNTMVQMVQTGLASMAIRHGVG
jgi:hypothetical protein